MTKEQSYPSIPDGVAVGWTQPSANIWTAWVCGRIVAVLYYSPEDNRPKGFFLALSGSPREHLLLHEDVHGNEINGPEDAAEALEQAGDLVALTSIGQPVAGFAAYPATELRVVIERDEGTAVEAEWCAGGTGSPDGPGVYLALDESEIAAVMCWLEKGAIGDESAPGFYLATSGEPKRIHHMEFGSDGKPIRARLDLPDAIVAASVWISQGPGGSEQLDKLETRRERKQNADSDQ